MNIDTSYRVPLKILIQNEKNKNISNIRTLYGQLGVDILENSKKPSILKNNQSKSNVFFDKLKCLFGMKKKEDYDDNDSLHKIMFKYIYNNKNVTLKDIEDMFGKEGKEHFKVFQTLNYVV